MVGAEGQPTRIAPGEVTGLLGDWADGNAEALAALIPQIYDELRRLAATHLRHERPEHTLQPTALLHEAYLRLAGQQRTRWQNRAHFFAVAARMMRRILVDHARARAADKRGGAAGSAAPIEEALVPSPQALDGALLELERLDAQQSRIVELRFFGGLTHEEIAAVLGVSVPTVARRWRLARAWLYRYLHDQA